MSSLRPSIIVAVLALPFAWVVAFFTVVRHPYGLDLIALPLIAAAAAGAWVAGILADLAVENRIYLLLGFCIPSLAIGATQLFLPPEMFLSQGLLAVFLSIFFCSGGGVVAMTTYLNQVVSCNERGRLAGLTAGLTLALGGTIALLWRISITLVPLLPGLLATLLLVSLTGLIALKPWRLERKTYMVPGSIRPYTAWWIIYVAAYGLYALGRPPHSRLLFNLSPFLFPPLGMTVAEASLIGVGGAAALFSLLPDRLGRKRAFSIATLLLGELCIFANTPQTVTIVWAVLMVCEIFVIGFIVGVGSWLVWAEIGSIRVKGRRAAFGWTVVLGMAGLLWAATVIGFSFETTLASLLYPVAATLVLFSLYPLTNALEVVWNERIVETLEIKVDTQQVSRAIRELEVTTPLRRLRQQIDNEIAVLASIPGVTKRMAILLRDEGYETPELIADAEPENLARTLGVPLQDAQQIKKRATRIVASRRKRHGLENHRPLPSRARRSGGKRKRAGG